MYRLTLISLICLILGSCARDRAISDTLADADRLIFEAPDSAVAILDSIRLDNASDFQLARYSLLLAKAREKAGIVVTDTPADSVLSSSIESLSDAAGQFRNRGDSLEAQTLFYRGVLLGYRGDYSEALISLMESADISKNTGDHFYLAMAYREQADIYSRLLAHKKRIELARLAAQHFKLANRPLHSVWEKVGEAYSWAVLGKSDSALVGLGNIKNLVLESDDPLLRADWLRAHALAAYQIGLCRSAIDDINSVHDLGYKLNANDCFIVGMSYRSVNNSDSAKFFLDRLSERARNTSDTLCMVRLKSLLANDSGNLSEALRLNNEYIRRKARITDNVITNPYISVLDNYYTNLTDNRTKELKHHRLWLTVISVLCLIILTVIVCLFYYRSRRNRRKVSLLVQEIKTIKSQRDSFIVSQQENSSTLLLLSGWAKSFERICEDFYRLPASKLKNGSKNSAIQILSDESTLQLLETIADKTQNGIMNRFRKLLPNLSDRQYRLALLLFMGFSTDAICTITGIARKNTVSVLKSRLKAVISSLDDPSACEFIAYF